MSTSKTMFIPFGVTAGVNLHIDDKGNLRFDFSHCSIIPSAYVPQVAAAMRDLWFNWRAAKRGLTKEVA